jgi:hypothetical protein
MYEVCRVQKLDREELAPFDEQFIDHLLEMVETTRNQQDESLNYAVIKLILALNEQFMVATLPSKPAKEAVVESPASTTMLGGIQTAPIPTASAVPIAIKETVKAMSLDAHSRNHVRAHTGSYGPDQSEESKKSNRVLMVLMRRLGTSKTFGENIVFMLNRAGELGPDRTDFRKHSGGYVHAASYPQDAVSSFHHAGNTRILLYKRFEGVARCLHSRTG